MMRTGGARLIRFDATMDAAKSRLRSTMASTRRCRSLFSTNESLWRFFACPSFIVAFTFSFCEYSSGSYSLGHNSNAAPPSRLSFDMTGDSFIALWGPRSLDQYAIWGTIREFSSLCARRYSASFIDSSWYENRACVG